MKKNCSRCGKLFDESELMHCPRKQTFNYVPSFYCAGCNGTISRAKALRSTRARFRTARPRAAHTGWGV